MALELDGTLVPTGDNEAGSRSRVLVDEAWASGNGDRQVTTPFKDERTLAGGANEDLDLQTLLDANGDALNLTAVRAIYVSVNPGAGAIQLSPGAANGWTSWISANLIVPEAGKVCSITPLTPLAVAGANKVLNVENLDGANATTYTIEVIGF